MINNGAKGYVLKNADSKEILEAIREVSIGGEYCCTASKLALKSLKISLTQIPKITRREKEVLLLVTQGLTTNEIAGKLFISPHTVESHRKNLMEKFDVKSMTSVISQVKELGLM